MPSLQTRKQAQRMTDPRAESGLLKRGFAVIAVLVEATHPLTLREIAEATQLSDSSLHRLLQSLCEARYVVRDGSRRYHASSRALVPLTIYHPLNVLRRDAVKPLGALREEFGLTSSLIVFAGMERLILDVWGATGTLSPYYGTHLDNPLHVSAAGKLLLLTLSQAERDAALGPCPYEALTPFSITNPDAFAEELEKIARQGFSTNIDENFVGFSAVAVPIICGPNQIVGCLVLTGATERFVEERIQEMGNSLRNTARLISLGSQSMRAIRAMFARAS